MEVRTVLKSLAAGIVSVVLITMFPIAATTAQETTDPAAASDPGQQTAASDDTAVQEQPEQAAPVTGPAKPNGADAKTYTYNPDTGLWENDYYTWNPVTKQTAPKTPQTYSYNPQTGKWDTTQWRYDAATGKYAPNTVSVAADQVPADQKPATSTGTYDQFYDAKISNDIKMDSKTGDASVSMNTTGGSATSGDASALLNLINLLQSSASPLQAGSLSVFNSNIYGDVQGDLMIDPGEVLSGPAAQPDSLSVKSENSGSIDNNINLAATSGNAAVSTNTTAGNATSGNVTAVANIVNVINSIIGSGQSFLGAINIYGTLDGDILLPPDVLQTLLASNNSADPASVSLARQSETAVTNNQAINNQVDLSASSGKATVANNTSAGSATSGTGQTNLTILNLVGNQIAGKDVLLVFVNVMGRWVGVLYSAPKGSTAAAIGGGITQNSALPSDNDVSATTNQTINNNVALTAASGNAAVTDNTTAGNATSGDAMAAANILNILNSTFSLAD